MVFKTTTAKFIRFNQTYRVLRQTLCKEGNETSKHISIPRH